MLAWPAFSSFIPSAHERKAGKLLLPLVVGPSCLLGPAHLQVFGCFWLCSCDTRNAGEDNVFFFFFSSCLLFFFLTSLVIIGVALLLKTLISLREAATVVLASSCCGVPGNVLVKPVDQRCSKLVCMCGSIGIIFQIMRRH